MAAVLGLDDDVFPRAGHLDGDDVLFPQSLPQQRVGDQVGAPVELPVRPADAAIPEQDWLIRFPVIRLLMT